MDFLCKRWQLADHAASAQGEFSIVVELFQDAQEIVLWNRSMQFKRRFLYGTCVYIKTGHLINSTYRVWLRWVCGNWEQWKHILSSWVHNNNFSDLWRLCFICCKLRSTDPRLLWYQRRQNRLAESGEGSNAPKTIPITRPEVLRALALLPKREAEGFARSGWKKFMVTERRVDRSSLQTRLAHLYGSVKICRCHWSG